MKLLLKPPPLAVLLALLVVLGIGSILSGVYLLAGVAVTLIVAGVLAVAVGLLVEI